MRIISLPFLGGIKMMYWLMEKLANFIKKITS